MRLICENLIREAALVIQVPIEVIGISLKVNVQLDNHINPCVLDDCMACMNASNTMHSSVLAIPFTIAAVPSYSTKLLQFQQLRSTVAAL